MTIKHPAPDKSKKDFTIEEIDGVQRIWAFGYPVRYYAPPAEDDYLARMKLIRGFTHSFFRLAEAGIEMPAESLDEMRRRFDATLDNAPDKRIRGAFLLGAIFARVEKTMRELIEKNHGVPQAIPQEIAGQLEEDFAEAYSLIENKYVRRKGPTGEIEKDDDEVLARAFGESVKLVRQPIKQIYEHRYKRIAVAQREIDRVANAMVSVAEKYEPLKPMIKMIKEMADLCKARSEVMREDIYLDWMTAGQPEKAADYVEIVVAFDVNKDGMKAFKLNLPSLVPESLSKSVQEALNAIQDGGALMRDMARVRVDRPKSVEKFLTKAKEAVTGRSGDGPWRVAG